MKWLVFVERAKRFSLLKITNTGHRDLTRHRKSTFIQIGMTAFSSRFIVTNYEWEGFRDDTDRTLSLI